MGYVNPNLSNTFGKRSIKTGKDRYDLFVFDGFLPPDLPDAPNSRALQPQYRKVGGLANRKKHRSCRPAT